MLFFGKSAEKIMGSDLKAHWPGSLKSGIDHAN
jgi:hypothetical protein